MTNIGHIVSGKRLAWNSFLNLGISLLIAALSIIFVPLMLHNFGTELYGVLSVKLHGWSRGGAGVIVWSVLYKVVPVSWKRLFKARLPRPEVMLGSLDWLDTSFETDLSKAY